MTESLLILVRRSAVTEDWSLVTAEHSHCGWSKLYPAKLTLALGTRCVRKRRGSLFFVMVIMIVLLAKGRGIRRWREKEGKGTGAEKNEDVSCPWTNSP